jgi:hypothetical protein
VLKNGHLHVKAQAKRDFLLQFYATDAHSLTTEAHHIPLHAFAACMRTTLTTDITLIHRYIWRIWFV